MWITSKCDNYTDAKMDDSPGLAIHMASNLSQVAWMKRLPDGDLQAGSAKVAGKRGLIGRGLGYDERMGERGYR